MATWLDKFGSWLNKGFHRSTRENNGLGNFLNGIDNLWNKITGSGLTGAEREANEYSARQAELAFERESEFYEKNQSMSAQIAAQREAGINPFGINGSASSGPVVNSSAPSSVAPTGSQGFDPIALAMQVAQFQLQKRATEAQIGKTTAETKNIETNTSWLGQINSTTLEKMRSEIKANEGAYDKAMQDIKESISRVDVNNSTIEVNGEHIQLMGSQRDLNASVQAINKLDAEKAEKLMPYVQARAEADIAYTTAKTQEAKFAAEKQMYEANISMLGVMREADLIDKGYYDNLVSQSKWEAKGAKRDYKWKPVNDVCSNLSKIAVGVGSVLTGVSSLMRVPSSSPVSAAPSKLTFF